MCRSSVKCWKGNGGAVCEASHRWVPFNPLIDARSGITGPGACRSLWKLEKLSWREPLCSFGIELSPSAWSFFNLRWRFPFERSRTKSLCNLSNKSYRLDSLVEVRVPSKLMRLSCVWIYELSFGTFLRWFEYIIFECWPRKMFAHSLARCVNCKPW